MTVGVGIAQLMSPSPRLPADVDQQLSDNYVILVEILVTALSWQADSFTW